MHTILLVDDEPVTRNGLKTMVDWASLGLELIGEEENGEAALSTLRKLKPDILLTDVRMPKMDGLELAKRVQEFLPQLKTVFISGYSDVDYVRSALKIGAYDYILKPINITELQDCLRKVVERLESESNAKISMDQLERQAEQGKPLLRQQLLEGLLTVDPDDAPRLSRRLMQLGVGENGQECCLLLLSPDEGEVEHCQGFQNNWRLLEVAIRNIAQEVFAGCAICHFAADPLVPQQLAAVLTGPPGSLQEESIYGAAVSLCQLLQQYLQLSLSVGIGNMVPRLGQLRESYETAADVLKRRLYMGGAQVLVSGTELPESLPVEEGGMEQVQTMLRGLHQEKTLNWLEDFFNRLASTRNTDIGFYRGKASRILFEAYVVLQAELSGSGESDLNHQNILDKLYKAQSLSQMKRVITAYCLDVQNLIRLKNDDATQGIIQQVKKRIKTEFHLPLTISELAAEVYLSPTYLCMLFRQEAGITINSYQTQVRMEHAKKLLGDLGNKLYDVSYAVGYSNPSYFSRQFKKYTGLLPSEYRNRIGGET